MRILSAIVLSAVLPLCASAQETSLPVIGLDYAFQLPDSIKAGPVIFTLKNQGMVHHQMLIYLMKEGKGLTEFVKATPQERGGLAEELLGVVFANAGVTAPGRLGIDLVRGRTYLLVCNDRDAADKPTHVQLGMVKSFVAK